jgi:hypothetical protein
VSSFCYIEFYREYRSFSTVDGLPGRHSYLTLRTPPGPVT